MGLCLEKRIMFDNTFQAVTITLFIIFAVGGVAVFATNPGLFGGSGGSAPVSITIWGSFDETAFSNTMQSAGITEDEQLSVEYRYVPESELRTQLVNALARDRGPDALLFPHTQLLKLDEFFVTVSSRTYSKRRFRNNFVEGAELFERPNGIIGLPFAMDPLVMYWNRDILTQAGFTAPPAQWSALSDYIDRITVVDDQRNISRATIALGTNDNITKSNETLASLYLQAGNPIVTRSGEAYSSTLSGTRRSGQQAEAGLRLYTQFANPSASSYTWNSNMPQDRQAFVSGRLSMYFDSGTAITGVRERNPNLNFDVARIPQRENGEPRTYADIYGLGLLDSVDRRRQSRVFEALSRLTSQNMAQTIVERTNYTAVHKSVVSNYNPEDPYKATLLDNAVIARGWLNPNPNRVDVVFQDMITGVTSGRKSVGGAVNDAGRSLDALLSQ